MAMEELIGQTLGGYRIISQVGKGGMATVYKAHQASLDRYVAVKVMPDYYAKEDESFLTRFKREARAVAKLRHPNILVVLDYGEQDGTTYIVMEYVEAGTLSGQLGRPVHLAETARLVEQVAGALEYAHDQGVIHRDIKPSNILLPKPDWALLTDFGLAKMVGGSLLTQTGMTVGTPAYMSPEQARGERVTTKSDIYSLGIVLYEMATGVVPFTAETPMAVAVKHIIDPLPLPRSKNPDLPEAVERIILKALAKEPADRYTRASEVAQALNSAVAEQPSLQAAAGSVTDATPTADTYARVAAETRPGEAAPAAVQAAGQVDGPRKSFLERLGRAKWPLVVGAGLLALVAVLAMAVPLLTNLPGLAELPQAAATAPAAGPQATRTVEQHLADGLAFVESGDLEAARAEFEAALAQEPQDPEVYWEIIWAYTGAGQRKAAADTIARALQAGPNEPWMHEQAGWAYFENGFYQQAVEQFERTIALDPRATGAYQGLSDAYRELGQPEKALASLQSALSVAGDRDPGLYENIGWQYLEHEAFDEAAAAFERAIAADPDLLGAWDGLAEVYWQQEDIDAAIEVMEQAIEAHPDMPQFYERIGWWRWDAGDLQGARAAFEQAIQVDPSYGPAYNGIAELYRAAGQEAEAIAILQEALKANPRQPALHESLGRLYLDTGSAREAIPYLEQAATLDEFNGWPLLELARAYLKTGRVEEARAQLQAASERNPDDPYLLESIGWAYVDQGDCATAKADPAAGRAGPPLDPGPC